MRFREVFEPQLRPWKIAQRLFSALGILAIVVAMAGVYAASSSTVAEQSHEIAVHRALGADDRTIAQRVTRDLAVSLALGLAAGVLLVIFSSKPITQLLYQIAPYNPWVLGVASIVLLLVALAGTALPLRRALGIDPASAFRQAESSIRFS
jgi:ABC-type antimicrobial peptide transport system permease subunit